ncbi:hypothetical protein H9P43_005358 [Blastocladiella emersonii ATCC 22665]|nr:hypothetical protein H9P43_005358 [Blastocladiella emersonii ATCC 22665]
MIHTLPCELTAHIASYLSPRDVAAISQTCASLHSALLPSLFRHPTITSPKHLAAVAATLQARGCTDALRTLTLADTSVVRGDYQPAPDADPVPWSTSPSAVFAGLEAIAIHGTSTRVGGAVEALESMLATVVDAGAAALLPNLSRTSVRFLDVAGDIGALAWCLDLVAAAPGISELAVSVLGTSPAEPAVEAAATTTSNEPDATASPVRRARRGSAASTLSTASSSSSSTATTTAADAAIPPLPHITTLRLHSCHLPSADLALLVTRCANLARLELGVSEALALARARAGVPTAPCIALRVDPNEAESAAATVDAVQWAAAAARGNVEVVVDADDAGVKRTWRALVDHALVEAAPAIAAAAAAAAAVGSKNGMGNKKDRSSSSKWFARPTGIKDWTRAVAGLFQRKPCAAESTDGGAVLDADVFGDWSDVFA